MNAIRHSLVASRMIDKQNTIKNEVVESIERYVRIAILSDIGTASLPFD